MSCSPHAEALLRPSNPGPRLWWPPGSHPANSIALQQFSSRHWFILGVESQTRISTSPRIQSEYWKLANSPRTDMREHFVIDPLISKRQQLLLATQLCRMVLKVRLPCFHPYLPLHPVATELAISISSLYHTPQRQEGRSRDLHSMRSSHVLRIPAPSHAPRLSLRQRAKGLEALRSTPFAEPLG